MKNPFFCYIDDFEKEAEEFLKRYECIDAIENPMPIPIRQIAEHLMALDIVDSEYLSSDDSVQGAITFKEGVVEVYDWSAQEYIGFEVNGPTIFVDASIINTGRYNNTLAHECFHWWKHRNYFNYKRTHEKGTEFAFRCNRKSFSRDSIVNGEWTEIDCMEWQAKTIAPKILMPRIATQKKVNEFYDRLLNNDKGYTKSVVTATVVELLATFFAVSRQSAAIRMLELGFKEAEPYCDMVYDEVSNIHPHIYKYTNAKRRQQPITVENAYKLSNQFELLKTTLNTGALVFADGYFVLRDSIYLNVDDNGVHLSEYAKTHLSECTIDFSVKLIPVYQSYRTLTTMFRSDSAFKEEKTYESNTQNTYIFNKARDFEKKYKREKEKSISSAEWMCRRMKEEHWEEYIFERRTHLDKMNFSRVNSCSHNFTKLPLLAMGVGLKLDIQEMEDVLKLGGMAFKPGDRSDEAYKYLFVGLYGRGIDECNRFLQEVGVEQLGTKEKN